MSIATHGLHQLAIGRQKGDQGSLVGIVERRGATLVDVISGHVENLGPEAFTLSVRLGQPARGSILLSGQPNDTDDITIDDGPTDVTFEFDSAGGITGDVAVAIGDTVAATRQNLVDAINASALTIKATLGVDGLIRLVHDLAGTAGNVTITGTDVATVQTLVGMSGGTGGVKNMRVDGAGVASVAVVPGGRVQFTLELTEADEQDFLSLHHTGGDAAFGLVTLRYAQGTWIRHERWQPS